MSTSIGDLKLQILIDTASLGDSLKTGLQMLQLFNKNASELIKLKPSASTSEFNSAMDKLIADGKRLETSLKGTAEAERRFAEETKKATTSVIDEVRAMNEGAGNSQKFIKALENIGFAVDGLRAVTSTLKQLKTEYVDTGLTLDVLRSSFNGTEQDLELFRSATANTVSEANLLKLSNQAYDLGVSLRDQSILFAMAEDAGDKYGEGVEQGFQRIIFATEGSTKALKSLGIQKAEYNKNVEEMTKAYIQENKLIDENNERRKLTINDLPIEEQKRIRLDAIIKSSGLTYDSVRNKVMDNKDKMDSLTVAIENQKAEIGSFIGRGLVRLIDSLGSVGLASKESAGFFVALGKGMVDILPIIAQLKIAFPNLAQTIISNFGKGGPVALAIIGTLMLLNGIVDRIDEIKREKAKIMSMPDPEPSPYQKVVTVKDGKIVSDENILKPDFTLVPVDANAIMKQQSEENKKYQEERNKKEEDLTEELEKQKSSRGGSLDNIEKEVDEVQVLIDNYRKLIDLHNILDKSKGQSVSSVLSEIQNLMASGKFNEEQLLNIARFRDELESRLEDQPFILSLGIDPDFGEQIKKDVQAIYDAWARTHLRQDGSLMTGKKPFDYADAFAKAVELRRKEKGENTTYADMKSILALYQQEIDKIRLSPDGSVNSSISYEQSKTMLDLQSKRDSILDDYKKNTLKIEDQIHKYKIDLIEEEFSQKEQKILEAFRLEQRELDEQLNRKELSPQEISMLRQTKGLSEQRKQQQLSNVAAEREKAIQDTIFSTYQSAIQASLSIYQIFGDSSDKIVQGFQKALEIVNIIKSVMDTVSIIKSLASLITAPFTGGLSLAGMAFASGGMVPGSGDSDSVPAWLTPGELIINKSRVRSLASAFGSGFLSWLNGGTLLSSSVNRYASGGIVSGSLPAFSAPIIREVPYIASTKLDGRSIQLVLRRIDKYDNLSRL